MISTEQLMEEHKGIKLMLIILEEFCKKLESGEKVDQDHLDQIIDFIRIFADKCHHGKEEDLLFPAMEKAGVPKEGGPIGVMLMEHDYGREYVKGMSQAIGKYKSGDTEASVEIVENARAYIELLTQHIYKEDNILYPIADKFLSEKTQKELYEDFEKIEIEKIGAGTHERFHELLHKLKNIYLKDSGDKS